MGSFFKCKHLTKLFAAWCLISDASHEKGCPSSFNNFLLKAELSIPICWHPFLSFLLQGNTRLISKIDSMDYFFHFLILEGTFEVSDTDIFLCWYWNHLAHKYFLLCSADFVLHWKRKKEIWIYKAKKK